MSRGAGVDRLPRPPFDRATPRFPGDANTIRLEQIPDQDATVLRRTYDLLRVIKEHTDDVHDPKAELVALRQVLETREYRAIRAAIDTMGATLLARGAGVDVRKAFHDIRGGSLPSLLLRLDRVAAGTASPGDLDRVFILTRDQLKILRNAVCDLDSEAYADDMQPKDHSIDLLREKWADVGYELPGHDVCITFDSSFEGAVSDRCMDFAALDRVLYNLVNNAARFAADGVVQVGAQPVVDDDGHTHLRFEVVNTMQPRHVQVLEEKFGGRLDALFRGGFTTGGGGLGMRICADFVVHGYGLDRVDTAVEGGFVGARTIDDHFVAWFYWPSGSDTTPGA